jgi:hypothetical protein
VTLTIGYAPCSRDFTAPGDRWRFSAYAQARGLRYELADPDRAYDLVVVTAAADVVTWGRRGARGQRLVFDIVDSYLAGSFGPQDVLRGVGKYALGDFGRPALSFRHVVRQICRRADAVVCSTVEQQRMIGLLCDNVHVILDVQDSAIHERKRDYRIGDTVNVFWEGLPYNLHEFAALSEVLRELNRERPVALHLMTLLDFGRYSGRLGRVQTSRLAGRVYDRVYLYQWNEHLLSRVASGCDLALIPLDLSKPMAAGKPANKLLLMWRMGMPALVSATPAYLRAMSEAGVEGGCRSERDWLHHMRRLLSDEHGRRMAAERGHAYATQEHSAERIFRRWDEVLQSIGLGDALTAAAEPR